MHWGNASVHQKFSLFKLIDNGEGFGEAVSMPRQRRRKFAGAICQVMNQGDRREEVFRKVRLAARRTKETTMNLNWIAADPAMGSWARVSGLPVAQRKQEGLKRELLTLA